MDERHPQAATDTRRAIHEMRVALTLIRVHTQMCKRWLRRNRGDGTDREIMRMAQVDTFVQRLARHLDDLEREEPSSSAD